MKLSKKYITENNLKCVDVYICHKLRTIDEDKLRVIGILQYNADENSIVFHTDH